MGGRWSERGAYVLVLIGVVGFSLNAGVSRIVLDAGMDPWTMAQIRAVGASLLLLAVLAVTGRLGGAAIGRSSWPRLAVYGLVGLGLLQSLFFEAINRIPIGLALLIQYLAPLWVALWAKFVQRQAVSRLLWPALGVTLTGLAVVAGASLQGTDPLGILAALGSGVSFAVYFILGERLVAQHDPFVVSFWGFTIAGVAWMLAAVLAPNMVPLWEVDPMAQAALPVGTSTLAVGLLVLWILTLGTVVPFGAETAAMRWLPATTVSVIAMLEPIGAGAVAWWWFDEELTAVQLVGAALVIVGVVLALLSRRMAVTPASPE